MTLARSLLVAAALLIAAPALADRSPTPDEVMAAVARGDLKPLAEIESKVRAEVPGEIIRVEIECEHERCIYEFKLLDAGGARTDVHVDGKSGAILKVKRK